MDNQKTFRFSLVFDQRNIDYDLDMELRLSTNDLVGKYGSLRIEIIEDILLEDHGEGVYFATVVVFKDRDVCKLAEAIYDFAVLFPPSRLPRVLHSHSTYFNLDYKNNDEVLGQTNNL